LHMGNSRSFGLVGVNYFCDANSNAPDV